HNARSLGVNVLASPRRDVAADSVEFQEFATAAGWGDGLPLGPPTADPAATVGAQLPPSGAPCTMEKLAINAVMAGAPAESLGLLVAALRAMSAPDFGCTRSTPPPGRSCRCSSSTAPS